MGKREAGMKAWMNHVAKRQRRHRAFRHVTRIKDQDLGLVLMRVEPLDDDGAFDVDRLAAEVEAWLSLIHIVYRSTRPRTVRQLVEEFPARLAGGGDPQHPELVILDSGEARVDGGEIRSAV